MNNKGQDVGIGTLLVVFIGVIVGLVLMTSTATFVGQTTNTVVLTNATFTAPAVNATIDLTGQDVLSTPVVNNETSSTAVSATFYTIDEGISTTSGLKSIQYTTTDLGSSMAGASVNISYDYGADGYIDNAGARSLTSIILIFAALAIAVFAMMPALKSIKDFT